MQPTLYIHLNPCTFVSSRQRRWSPNWRLFLLWAHPTWPVWWRTARWATAFPETCTGKRTCCWAACSRWAPASKSWTSREKHPVCVCVRVWEREWLYRIVYKMFYQKEIKKNHNLLIINGLRNCRITAISHERECYTARYRTAVYRNTALSLVWFRLSNYLPYWHCLIPSLRVCYLFCSKCQRSTVGADG